MIYDTFCFFNEFALPLPEHYVGIEFEMERWSQVASTAIKKCLDYGTLVPDGSLRNNGYEFVTKPLKANAALALADELYRSLPDYIEFSPRTSTHVHVNVQDFTWQQIQSIVSVYLVVEKLLYYWVGGRRDKSIFCVPLNECNLMANFGNDNYNPVSFWMKYSGLNLKPVANYGTIEFRHLGGTNDIKQLHAWLYYILSIVKWATSHTTKQVSQTLFNLNSNSAYSAFLWELFDGNASYALMRMPNWEKAIENSVAFLKVNSLIKNGFSTYLKENQSTNSPLFERLCFTYGNLRRTFTEKSVLGNVYVNPAPDITTAAQVNELLDALEDDYQEQEPNHDEDDFGGN